MLIAILTDIHANREALSACLAHAKDRNVQRYAFLGDFVGYGADPAWVVDTVMEYVGRGAIAVQGNHDVAVTQAPSKHMNPDARQVIEWTRAQLNETQLAFLDKLPLTQELNNLLFVHATAADPKGWEYINGIMEAIKSMHATKCRITFAGHVHEPALYNLSPTGKVSSFVPTGDSSIPLGTQRRWLVLPGSVGQPRDGNPAACYSVFDDATNELIYFRVPYDYESAAAKIRSAGLPQSIGSRLERGR